MENKKLNEFHVWLIDSHQYNINWEQYNKLIEPKVSEALDSFLQDPIKLMEYAKSINSLTPEDEKYYNKLFENRKSCMNDLKKSFSLEKINDHYFGIVCDFSKLLTTVPNYKNMQNKYLFDFTDDELKLNEMHEVINEVAQKLVGLSIKSIINDKENGELVANILNNSTFYQINELDEITEQLNTPVTNKVKKFR